MADSFPKDLVSPGAKIEKIAGDMKFLEGPAWLDWDGGFLIFSDIPGDVIYRWSEKAGIGIFLKPANNPNGHTVDSQGRLVGCETGTRRVVRFDRDNQSEILVDRYQGKRFNSPNDVIVKSDGTIWFSDPDYNVPKGESRELDHKSVYRFDPATKDLKIVRSDFDMCNGLCFSPDESKLYIADSGKPKHIRIFDVGQRGELSGGEVFCRIEPGAPDGIRCDEIGNLWSSAGDGLHVYSSSGKLLGKIPVPETPSNFCFGGDDGRTIFITARSSVYRVKVNVGGARLSR